MHSLINSKGQKRRVLGLFSLERRRSRGYQAAVIQDVGMHVPFAEKVSATHSSFAVLPITP